MSPPFRFIFDRSDDCLMIVLNIDPPSFSRIIHFKTIEKQYDNDRDRPEKWFHTETLYIQLDGDYLEWKKKLLKNVFLIFPLVFLYKLVLCIPCLRKSFHRRRSESIVVYLSFHGHAMTWQFMTVVHVVLFSIAAKFMFLFCDFRVLNSDIWNEGGARKPKWLFFVWYIVVIIRRDKTRLKRRAKLNRNVSFLTGNNDGVCILF